MSSLRQEDHGEKQPRWQFRKKKKIEKRRNKRQMLAEKNKPTVNDTLDKSRSTNESTAEKQLYEQEKAHWEEKERKFNLIEVAKKKARQKEEEAKVLTQKRWQETLMTLPLLPPKFSLNKDRVRTEIPTASPMKAFVSSEKDRPKKITYRDRFLQRKKRKTQHQP